MEEELRSRKIPSYVADDEPVPSDAEIDRYLEEKYFGGRRVKEKPELGEDESNQEKEEQS
ncbi:MAG: hypothetical protein ACD_37C00296G0003 [uncultured bacterium]|nr:MAG: hypothetical protein ACD_37C00296G0003 [uncultured bacterium]